jgi:lambda family phage tail tape measure protein
MADINVSMGVDNSQALKSLKQVEDAVGKVTKTFEGLRNAIAGLALGSFISNAIKSADAISDLSDTTGIAVEHILALGTAFTENGGNADDANKSVLKFAQTIGDAIDGADSAQKAFEQVGVSLKDIQTMSEQELLKKTIDGLGKMENASMRIATQTALFGKNARAINFQGVSAGMGAAVESSAKYADAIKSGAAAQQSLEVNMKNLTIALLKVIQPLNDLVSKINISVEAFESLVKAVGYGLAVFLAFSRVLPAITGAANGVIGFFSKAGGVIATLGGILASVGKELMGFVNLWIRFLFTGGGATSVINAITGSLALLGRAFVRLLGVVGIVMTVAEAVNFLSIQFLKFDIIDWVVKKFVALKNAAMDFFNIKPDATDETEAETKRLKNQAQAYEENKAKLEEFAKRRAKLQQEISKTSDALKFENEQQLNALALETRLVGKTDEQQESVRAVAELYKKQDEAIKSLLDKRKEWAQGTEEQKANLGVIDEEIAKIKELTKTQVDSVTEYIGRLQGARLLEQDRVNTLQRITDQMEKQKALDEAMLQIRQSTKTQLDTVTFQKSQVGKTPLEQQLAQIQEEARLAALEAGRAFSSQFTAEDMGADDAKKLADGLNLIAEKYKEVADAKTKLVMESRTFSYGWTEAFNAYADSATNAAMIAGNAFSSVTRGMENAIDRFVETGKFSFSDMASSIIKDLIKIEMKAQAMELWKMFRGGMGGGAGGGIMSGIGGWLTGLLGFADGGQPPMNRPSIVGENGPELFMPRSVGTIIPNSQLGGNNPSNPQPAAAQSAPKPQQIITHNTYVTNNVSAIDAKGVAQLFAENRRSLFGAVETARREMPSGARA